MSEKGDRRILRIEKEMREIIGAYLIHGFRGELRGFISVPRVQVSRDLRHAKVYVSVMGSEEDKGASIDELVAHAHEVQAEVNRQMRMRFTPKIEFKLDTSMEKTLKVERILRDLAAERAGGGAAGSQAGGAATDGLSSVDDESFDDDADGGSRDER